jgi:hypothetical protein
MTKKIGCAVLAVLVIAPYSAFGWTLSSSLAGGAAFLNEDAGDPEATKTHYPFFATLGGDFGRVGVRADFSRRHERSVFRPGPIWEAGVTAEYVPLYGERWEIFGAGGLGFSRAPVGDAWMVGSPPTYDWTPIAAAGVRTGPFAKVGVAGNVNYRERQQVLDSVIHMSYGAVESPTITAAVAADYRPVDRVAFGLEYRRVWYGPYEYYPGHAGEIRRTEGFLTAVESYALFVLSFDLIRAG